MKVDVFDGALEVDAPEQVLTPKVLETIGEHKRELRLELLDERAIEAAWSTGRTKNGWPVEVDAGTLFRDEQSKAA